eukprot:131158-Chlamydomonas_euryale.AAC.11
MLCFGRVCHISEHLTGAGSQLDQSPTPRSPLGAKLSGHPCRPLNPILPESEIVNHICSMHQASCATVESTT